MSRYIDTLELLWLYEHECEKYSSLEELVADVPTADVIEVVRCKDCKNWQRDWKLPSRNHYCALMDRGSDGTFFCAYGERRN